MAKTMKEREKVTIEEWLSLPEGPPFYEIEDGRLIEVPSPRREHQRILARLTTFLDDFAMEHNLGTVVMDVDVVLPTGVGYIPDIAFVLREREEELLVPDGKVHGAPDLVVEVISPTTRRRDRVKKFRNYWRAGVRWLWFVDSEELTVEEFKWTEEGYLCSTVADKGEDFEPKALPGLKLNLEELLKPRRTSEEDKESTSRKGRHLGNVKTPRG